MGNGAYRYGELLLSTEVEAQMSWKATQKQLLA
jgi:hypothetical protein